MILLVYIVVTWQNVNIYTLFNSIFGISQLLRDISVCLPFWF